MSNYKNFILYDLKYSIKVSINFKNYYKNSYIFITIIYY